MLAFLYFKCDIFIFAYVFLFVASFWPWNGSKGHIG